MQVLLKGIIEYESLANKLVYKLLSELSAEERAKDRKSYYKSLDAIFAHHVKAGMAFIEVLSSNIPSSTWKKYDVKNISDGDAIKLFEEVDICFINFINSATPDELTTQIDFHGKKFLVEEFLVMWARHGAHHRGQISQIFDEMQIDHDLILLKG